MILNSNKINWRSKKGLNIIGTRHLAGENDVNQNIYAREAMARVVAERLGGEGIYNWEDITIDDLPNGHTEFPAIAIIIYDDDDKAWYFRTEDAVPISFSAANIPAASLYAVIDTLDLTKFAKADIGSILFVAQATIASAPEHSIKLGTGVVVSSAFTSYTSEDIFISFSGDLSWIISADSVGSQIVDTGDTVTIIGDEGVSTQLINKSEIGNLALDVNIDIAEESGLEFTDNKLRIKTVPFGVVHINSENELVAEADWNADGDSGTTQKISINDIFNLVGGNDIQTYTTAPPEPPAPPDPPEPPTPPDPPGPEPPYPGGALEFDVALFSDPLRNVTFWSNEQFRSVDGVTLSCWLYFEDFVFPNIVIGGYDYGFEIIGSNIYMNYAWASTEGGEAIGHSSRLIDFSIALEEWNHFAITIKEAMSGDEPPVSGILISSYINGIDSGTSVFVPGVYIGYTSSANFIIGEYATRPSTTNIAKIDELSLFGHALTSEEIETLAELTPLTGNEDDLRLLLHFDGDITDSGPNSFTGVLNGTLTYGDGCIPSGLEMSRPMKFDLPTNTKKLYIDLASDIETVNQWTEDQTFNNFTVEKKLYVNNTEIKPNSNQHNSILIIPPIEEIRKLLVNGPKIRLKCDGTTQTINDSTLTYINFMNESYKDGFYWSSTNRSSVILTEGTTDTFIFVVLAAFETDSNGYREIGIRIDSTDIPITRTEALSNKETIIFGTYIGTLNYQSTIKMYVRQDSGSTLDIIGEYTTIEIFRMVKE
jgi:hypothetical protein